MPRWFIYLDYALIDRYADDFLIKLQIKKPFMDVNGWACDAM